MITKKQFEIFLQFGGDSDGFARLASESDRKLLGEENWAAISILVQEIGILNSGLVNSDFRQRIESALFSQTINPELAERIPVFSSST